MSTPCHPWAPQGFYVIFFILGKFPRGIPSETKSSVVYHLLSLLTTTKFCMSIVFIFSWELKWPQEKLYTMLMQNFVVTNKEHYGMLWYFLYWSVTGKLLIFWFCLFYKVFEEVQNALTSLGDWKSCPISRCHHLQCTFHFLEIFLKFYLHNYLAIYMHGVATDHACESFSRLEKQFVSYGDVINFRVLANVISRWSAL